MRERLSNTLRVRNETRGTVLADRCRVASSYWARMWGLIPRSRLEAGESLLLPHTSSITMLFMRMQIDAVAVDRDGAVVRCWERLAPWGLAYFAPRADRVVELPAGTIAASRTAIGDRLVLLGSADAEPDPP